MSVSIPCGRNFGVVGLLPYLPLPTKLVTAVMPEIMPDADESADDLAVRVRDAMQTRLDALTAGHTAPRVNGPVFTRDLMRQE